MANGSVEENIQFSLETIDFDEDIEMTDELFRNEDVEETVYCHKRKFQASKLQMKGILQLVLLQLFLSTTKILLVW